jgi:pyruvate dehydrogenase phosphatase
LQPRWNKALLEVFRVDYVGASPYITCKPFLRHHCLGPRDKFLILASDGLYEYFTNEDVVARVEAFVTRYPDEDPAKYLSHEILLRAANQAGEHVTPLVVLIWVNYGDMLFVQLRKQTILRKVKFFTHGGNL